jgi:alpha-1,2-mannosyltransferase
MSQPKWKLYPVLTILILICAAPVDDAVHEWFVPRSGGRPDFGIYYLGGKLARSHGDLYPAFAAQGQSPWEWAPPGTVWDKATRAEGFPHLFPFITPPFSGLVFEPFALLPASDALFAWRLATVLMTAIAVLLVCLTFSEGLDVAWFVVMLAAVFASHPFKQTIHMGQLDGVMLLCWGAGLYAARKNPVASALAFALGTVVKVTPAIAVPLFVIRRQWRWLAAYSAWVLVLTGVSVWALGWNNHLTWATKVFPLMSQGGESFQNRSLLGFALALAHPHDLVGYARVSYQFDVHAAGGALPLFAGGIGLMLYGFFLARSWFRAEADALTEDLAILPLVGLLIAPLSWQHYYLLAALPLIYLWRKVPRWSGYRVTVLAVCTLILGTTAFDYVAVLSHWLPLQVLAVGAWPMAGLALICVEWHSLQAEASVRAGMVNRSIPSGN